MAQPALPRSTTRPGAGPRGVKHRSGAINAVRARAGWWWVPAVSAPELSAPGQAGSAAQLPSDAGHGVRAALTDLFPEPAEPAPRAGLARWAFLPVQVAAVALGALVLLVRIGGRPSWQSVWAEDRGIYLPGALAHPWHLLQSYGGDPHVVPPPVGPGGAPGAGRGAPVAPGGRGPLLPSPGGRVSLP